MARAAEGANLPCAGSSLGTLCTAGEARSSLPMGSEGLLSLRCYGCMTVSKTVGQGSIPWGGASVTNQCHFCDITFARLRACRLLCGRSESFEDVCERIQFACFVKVRALLMHFSARSRTLRFAHFLRYCLRNMSYKSYKCLYKRRSRHP